MRKCSLLEFKRVMPSDAVMVESNGTNRAAALKTVALVRKMRGCPYTEIDTGGRRLGYWRGFHLVNRTGRYVVLPNRFDDWVRECEKLGLETSQMTKMVAEK